jgi:hypothetical protein
MMQQQMALLTQQQAMISQMNQNGQQPSFMPATNQNFN